MRAAIGYVIQRHIVVKVCPLCGKGPVIHGFGGGPPYNRNCDWCARNYDIEIQDAPVAVGTRASASRRHNNNRRRGRWNRKETQWPTTRT